MKLWLPTVEAVLLLHRKLIEQTGGSNGIRSMPLIESALGRAMTSFAGEEAHKTLAAKAAAIGCGLVKNHGFVDGNKRIGIAVMLLVLRRNHFVLTYSQTELTNLGMDIATGQADVEQVITWIEAHAQA